MSFVIFSYFIQESIEKTAKIERFAILTPLNGIFMLISHTDLKRLIQKTLLAKFRRSKFSALPGETLKEAKNDDFWAF